MAEITERGPSVTRVASGNLDGSQFTFVRQGSQLDVLTVVSTGQPPMGVQQNKPLDNEHATIVIDGQTKIRLANSLGPNIWITTGESGWAIQASSGHNAYGKLIYGGTSGTLGVVQLDRHYVSSL